MKFLKNEDGMTRVRLTLVILSIIIIVALSIVLIIGENGISLKTETKNEAVISEDNTEKSTSNLDENNEVNNIEEETEDSTYSNS